MLNHTASRNIMKMVTVRPDDRRKVTVVLPMTMTEAIDRFSPFGNRCDPKADTDGLFNPIKSTDLGKRIAKHMMMVGRVG